MELDLSHPSIEDLRRKAQKRIPRFAFEYLDSATGNAAGTSSTTHGYMHGGYPSYRNVIQKYSFSVDGNSTDVGDLVNGVSSSSGSQH